MTAAETWDEGGDPYLRYLDSGGAAEDANRLREARQQRNGEDIDYFAARAAWALTAKTAAEERATALTAALDQEQARVVELEAEHGTCTDDHRANIAGRVAIIGAVLVAAWVCILSAGYVLWDRVLPALVEWVAR